ncbi:MAG: hypothetical protein CVV45_06615 [Spirochaetae bacterium HGW-Spirochaetae-10]|nr:MAG: hypothetical protein CVV45_06615 [Spirochaetae bacterium HGW-Spirochaetae-10]
MFRSSDNKEHRAPQSRRLWNAHLLIAVTALILFCAGGSASSQSAGSYDDLYNSGIHSLYTLNRAEEARSFFEEASRTDDSRWQAHFMIGFIDRAYLKTPGRAIPYLQRAEQLSADTDHLPSLELAVAFSELEDASSAIRWNLKAQRLMREGGKGIDPWIGELLAYNYFQLGDTNRALAASSTGWVHEYLQPRTVRLEWNIRLGRALRDWRLDAETKIRLTLPLDRPYQKITAFRISPIQGRQMNEMGNRLIEIERPQSGWPETMRLELTVQQNMKSMSPSSLAIAAPGTDLFAYASDNQGGYNALDNPEFTQMIRSVTSQGSNPGEKVKLAMNHLRSNFRYDSRIAEGNIYDMFQSGQGDCGYYSAIAVGFIRALGVPVRFVYGLNTGFDPPTPHAIIEIYDAKSGRWFPHDPQSKLLYGIINPTYIPFTAFDPSSNAFFRSSQDGVLIVDTTQFFWGGSGNDTLAVNISVPESTLSHRSTPTPPAGFVLPGPAKAPARKGKGL